MRPVTTATIKALRAFVFRPMAGNPSHPHCGWSLTGKLKLDDPVGAMQAKVLMLTATNGGCACILRTPTAAASILITDTGGKHA